MPTCKKCGESFPNWTRIDGKKKLLAKRKYCLKCSPWGQHNTRPLDDKRPTAVPSSTIQCVCVYCKRNYVYNPQRKKGFTKTQCNSCIVNRRRFKTKLRAIEYKGGKCTKCGYTYNASCMTFHHLDPAQKDFDIGGAHCHSWETLKAELDKCILLCHNCHGDLHNPDTQLILTPEGLVYKYNKYGPLV